MKLLNLIGKCGNETVKDILKEKQYDGKDFYYLKRWVLKNYRDKILASSGKTLNDYGIDISFSFINKDDKEENIYFLNEKIIKYYSKCEGRIYWSSFISKYELPKFDYIAPPVYNSPTVFNPPLVSERIAGFHQMVSATRKLFVILIEIIAFIVVIYVLIKCFMSLLVTVPKIWAM